MIIIAIYVMVPSFAVGAGAAGNAAAIILLHNHPSGDPTPSAEDLSITTRLRQVGDVLGIRVLDHVVIGDRRYVSFVDDGYLQQHAG